LKFYEDNFHYALSIFSIFFFFIWEIVTEYLHFIISVRILKDFELRYLMHKFNENFVLVWECLFLWLRVCKGDIWCILF
jgi:hypothetical protein